MDLLCHFDKYSLMVYVLSEIDYNISQKVSLSLHLWSCKPLISDNLYQCLLSKPFLAITGGVKSLDSLSFLNLLTSSSSVPICSYGRSDLHWFDDWSHRDFYRRFFETRTVMTVKLNSLFLHTEFTHVTDTLFQNKVYNWSTAHFKQ